MNPNLPISLPIAALLLTAATPPAHADDATAAAKNGTCEQKQPTVRYCYPAGAVGQFDVKMAPGVRMLVQLDEPVQQFLPPPSDAIASKLIADNTVIVLAARKDRWPETTTAVVRTEHFTVTLKFSRADADEADTQLHILDAASSTRDKEVERRVDQQRKVLEEEFAEKEAALDQRAEDLARKQLLDAVFEGGSAIRTAGGTRRARHDHLVLHTGKVVRLGSHRLLYLTLSIENRDRPRFSIGTIATWLTDGDSKRTLKRSIRCSTLRIAGGDEATCVLAITFPHAPKDAERLRVRVREKAGDRAVTLSGIDVR